MAPQISDAAVSMILGFEVGSAAEYIEHPTWPGGASGITIGVGYDLGYATAADIGKDWAALGNGALIRLQSCAGRKGASAASMRHNVADIIIPWAPASAVFQTRDIPRYTAMTIAAFPNAAELAGDSLGALVSLVFNRGASMTDTQPGNRLEMRRIRDACAAREFASVPGFIRSMRRLWIRDPDMAGLVTRREAEAMLFEQGLAPQIAQAPTPPEPAAPAAAAHTDEADLLDDEYNTQGV